MTDSLRLTFKAVANNKQINRYIKIQNELNESELFKEDIKHLIQENNRIMEQIQNLDMGYGEMYTEEELADISL